MIPSLPPWLGFGLVCAFFYASHGALSKRLLEHVDSVVVVWATSVFALPASLAYAGVEPLVAPTAPFAWALAGVVAINGLSYSMYNRAIRSSDLSLVIPLLAFTPVWMLATSAWMLGESPRPAGVAGILLIVAGTLALKPEGARGILGPLRALADDRGARTMMAVALLWSITANLDKIAITATSASTYLIAFQLAFALTFLPAVLQPDRRRQIRVHWRSLMLLGILGSGMWVAQFLALRLTLAPYVIAMKRAGLLFSILYGHYLFSEKGIRSRLAGGGTIIAGMFLIAYGSLEE